jgi:hypothetical protein
MPAGAPITHQQDIGDAFYDAWQLVWRYIAEDLSD